MKEFVDFVGGIFIGILFLLGAVGAFMYPIYARNEGNKTGYYSYVGTSFILGYVLAIVGVWMIVYTILVALGMVTASM